MSYPPRAVTMRGLPRTVIPTVTSPEPDPVPFGAFGFKPPDLGPQLFDRLTAGVDGLMGAALTAHHDPDRQAYPTGTGVAATANHDCMTSLSLTAIYGLRTDLVYIVHE
jgi:hypothetical protein